jgi:rhamnosyltransferase
MNPIHNQKIAACVVLYNSSLNCLNCIATYQHQVERVYVVDNSEQPDSDLVTHLLAIPTVQYMPNGGNLGIATALNRAASRAINDGFTYLLTMDDDTKMPPNGVVQILLVFEQHHSSKPIGLVSGIHTRPRIAETIKSVPYTMTSGNLLSLHAYQQAGPFRDELFIDHVDHEYGLRLNRMGFLVIELNTLRLDHRLGLKKSVWGGMYSFISHSPQRTYYIVRNGLVVAQEYGEFRRRAFVLILKEWLKAVLFEKQKRLRLRLFWRGLTDGRKGRLGKLDQVY